MEIIAKPDMRFASLSATEFEIAVSGAMCSLVKECSIKGAESFSDHWVPHVRLIKRNSLQDRTRRVTFKRKNKAGQIEYVQRITRDEGAVAAIANCVAAQTSAPECIEMIERSKQIHRLYGLVRNYVAEMKIDDLSKRAFSLYLAGECYNDIGEAVYGRYKTKKQMTNKVSAAIHKIATEIRYVHGEKAKQILRPTQPVYERYI